jgi:hypothetical protein
MFQFFFFNFLKVEKVENLLKLFESNDENIKKV